MQPLDENNIKKAFDEWDNTPVSIGYNKQNIRQRMPFAQTRNWSQQLSKLAAIALIGLLSGSLIYALLRNQSLMKDNQLLANQHNQFQEEISHLKSSILNNKSTPEVKVVTVVKEKMVSDPSCDQNQLLLQNQVVQLEDENMSLKESLNQLSLASDDLNDSIQTLLANMDEIQQEYLTVLDKIKNKQSFDINYDQKLMAATSDNNVFNAKHINNEEKIQIKLSGTAKSKTPIRRTVLFR